MWTSEDADLKGLTEAYYGHIAEEDLRQIGPDQRRQGVAAHVKLAAQRSTAAPAISVTTVGHRSVVQVVTEDMPYLVDSVTSEVTRCGHAISLVVHPILDCRRD